METSILQQIKRKAGKFIEPQLLKIGRVLDVRAWEAAAMVEIDLHLPFANIQEWNEVPCIKFRVDNLCFRDYTPFGWDAETCTCSLLVDTAHDGPGSRWAKNLQTGDAVQYLKIQGTHQSPHPTDLVVGLGDTSSLAHLLALQQLTLPRTRFEGAVLLDNPLTGELFSNYFRSPVNTVATRDGLAGWLNKQGYCTPHTWFYLTGNHYMVAALRKQLKNMGYQNIKEKGFWH